MNEEEFSPLLSPRKRLAKKNNKALRSTGTRGQPSIQWRLIMYYKIYPRYFSVAKRAKGQGQVRGLWRGKRNKVEVVSALNAFY